MSGLGQSPMAFNSHDSNSCGSNNSAVGLEPSPEKPVTNPRTPTERKRKRKTAATPNAASPAALLAPGATGPIPDIMAEAHKTGNKPISDYFSKRYIFFRLLNTTAVSILAIFFIEI